MKYDQDRFAIRRITSLTTAFAFLLLLSIPALAQRTANNVANRPNSTGGHNNGSQIGLEDELRLRGAVSDKGPETEAKLRVILDQINEDFQRIQAINDNILGMLKAHNELNYKSITEMTGELKKRARRFKDNANLPPPAAVSKGEKKLDEVGQAEIKDALSMLNDRINKFVDNPLFQKPEWTDQVLGARASRDLETIIELSGQIKKSAEKLNKSAQ